MKGRSCVRLAEGSDLLRKHTSEIIWRGRSLFLCAGCEEEIPGFRLSVISDHKREGGRSDPCSAQRRVAMAFEPDEKTREWALNCGAELLGAQEKIVTNVGDKSHLPEILACAHVSSIPSRVYEAQSYPDVGQLWQAFDGTPVVVQRAANNMTGKGTCLVEDQRKLSEVFAMWGEERLKVSRYLDGIPLTISGCVAPNQTVVSLISRQLVGIPRLTSIWGAHCGNQLATVEELGDDVAGLCFDACREVGNELRQRGFLGAFGLDLLQTVDREVFVVEINPRLQSVSSLVNLAEIEANMLPLPGVHLLSFLLEEVPVVAVEGESAIPQLDQTVLYSRRRGEICKAPETGVYALEGDVLARLGGYRSLRYISGDEALVWSFVRPGECINEDERLCVLQTRFRLAQIGHAPLLTDRALQWMDALESSFRYCT